uniref:F-box domain-containing protein n=2 Tax=Leersia perrieri TaxID=77586 RepID=A0A0D9VMK8_9ORYZ
MGTGGLKQCVPWKHRQGKKRIEIRNPEPESEMEMEEEESDCEMTRLPEELLVEVLALTTPRDACRAAAVCRDFRAVTDSDAVWSLFLPPRSDLLPLAADDPPSTSSKGIFLRLSDGPLLLPHDHLRDNGAKCYMLSARKLQICRLDGNGMPQYWRWIPLDDSRFREGAKLLSACWLEIRGKIDSKLLSRNTNYAAYLVCKIADDSFGLELPFQEASVIIRGSTTTCQVAIVERMIIRRYTPVAVLAEDIEHPHKRADSWMELKLGEFYNEEGDDGEVCISFMETEEHNPKSGIVVQGIEIRPKKILPLNSLACSHENSMLTTYSFSEETVLTDGLTSMWLGRDTGIKCYMLSARALQIPDLADNWRWISLTGSSRFSEVVELLDSDDLEIIAKIPCKMLSENSNYAAYIVFVELENSCGLPSVLDTSISVGGSQFTKTQQVCFDSDVHMSGWIGTLEDEDVILAQESADGWMELDLGEFCVEEGNNEGELCISLVVMQENKWLGLGGLIIQGMEIRPRNRSIVNHLHEKAG